tara:strand:- start:505 stop:723 length:219 start_codon:yes stop_codon:yes gene_type:complete
MIIFMVTGGVVLGFLAVLLRWCRWHVRLLVWRNGLAEVLRIGLTPSAGICERKSPASACMPGGVGGETSGDV